MRTPIKLGVLCRSAVALAVVASCADSRGPTTGTEGERVAKTSQALLSSQWTAAVSMNTARQNHVAALLQNGSVLVAGGHPGNNVPTNAAEVFSPGTGAWTVVGSMSTARRLFGACTLASGKVLVAGGNAGAGDVTSAEIFDPTANAWSTTGSLAAAREDFSMTCLSDGRVLVAGGSGPSGLLSSAEVYDPNAGTWSSAGTMPAAVHTQGAVLLNDGRVLVAGGNNSAGPVTTAAIWTPSTNAWTATGSMATARAFYALDLLGDGRVLAAGGLVNVLGGSTNRSEIYSPSTGTWSAAANLNTARYSGASAVLSTGPIVVGGVNGGSPLASSESYDSVHNTWTQLTAIYGAVNQTATALSPASVLVAGGNTGSQATKSAQTYGLLNVFALYAQRSVTIGSSDHIYGGDVGVAGLAASSFGPQLVVGASATVQTDHNLVAPSVSLASGAHVGDVQTNSLTNSGATLGTQASYPTSLPSLPLALPSGAGGSDVTVPALTITTLNPGNYGNLNVTGTVYLNAGSYTFTSVTMAAQAHLAGVSGTATVAVSGTFQAGNSVSISSPGGAPAGQLMISVAGSDSGATPAFSIGTSAAMSAVLSAPHGTLSIGGSSTATGAFMGFDVNLGSGVTINYQNGFVGTSSATGPRQTVSSYQMPPPSPLIGPVPANTVLSFAVGLPLRNFAALQAIAESASDPTSASYQSFLGPNDFPNNYQPLAADYSALAAWGTSNGLAVVQYPNAMLIDVTGTAAQIEQALLVNLNYASRPDGTTFYGPDRQPTLGLGTTILGVSGVDDYVALTPLNGPVQPCPANTLTASTVATNLFGGTSCATLDGTNQSIGIMAPCGFSTSDVTGYEQNMGMTGVPAVEIQVSNDPNGLSPGCPTCTGALAPPRPANGDTECVSDIEMALTVTPKAQIIAFEGTNPDSILANMAANPSVRQLSSSYKANVSGLTQTLLTVLAAQGQSFVQSSGDSGAYQPASMSCGANAPPTDIRSLNFVTLVGSIAMTQGGVQSGSIFSGGGILPNFTIPKYQANLNVGISGSDPSVSTTNRNAPDVAMVGENMCEIVSTCSITPASGQGCPQADLSTGQAVDQVGTSLTAPMFASVLALIDQASVHPGPLGFANPALYQAAAQKSFTFSAFTDVDDGSSNTNSCGFGYQTMPGYDFVTGLGTPTCGLVQSLGGLPSVSVSASGTTGGPFICVAGQKFTPNGSVTVEISGIPSSNSGGGAPGCPVKTVTFETINAASDGTVKITDNEISEVPYQLSLGASCCTSAEIANGVVTFTIVDNTTGLTGTATMPASYWCATGQTSQNFNGGCQPPPVTIDYHQVGACNGDPNANTPYSVGSNQAMVVFHLEDVDNSLGTQSFSFDPANLFVQQSSGEDHFNSSLDIYPELFGSSAAVPQTVTAGMDFAYQFGAFGAAVVSTTNPDGAAEANTKVYTLGYFQAVTDPQVVVNNDGLQTSFPDTEDCSDMSPLH